MWIVCECECVCCLPYYSMHCGVYARKLVSFSFFKKLQYF